MLSLEDGRKAVELARYVIDKYVKDKNSPEKNLKGPFLANQGAFVSIHTYPKKDLRGCIGIPLPVMSLQKAIIEGALSATCDPRFPPVTVNELDSIIIEVTVLTRPEEIIVKDPKDYVNEIVIGRDGLIVEKGFYKGLLLPQVPVEWNWNVEDFLANTCMKAGLMPDAWFERDIKIFRFSGQVFSELEPRGDIKEKELDGSCD
jgi:uncharacterized protein (TIGR00296 family)